MWHLAEALGAQESGEGAGQQERTEDHRVTNELISSWEGEEALVGSGCHDDLAEGTVMACRQPGPLCTGGCWAPWLQSLQKMLCYHLTKLTCEHLALSASFMALSCSCI